MNEATIAVEPKGAKGYGLTWTGYDDAGNRLYPGDLTTETETWRGPTVWCGGCMPYAFDQMIGGRQFAVFAIYGEDDRPVAYEIPTAGRVVRTREEWIAAHEMEAAAE